MRILAIDTTSEFGSLALVAENRVLEEVPLHSPDGFAHVIFQQIRGLLEKHALRLADLDGFAAAAGPGSFTGVRVGLTVVKGLAEATARPGMAVSNLQALAWFGSRDLRATLLDARRGEVYGAVYNAALELVRDETVGPLQDWLDKLPSGDLEIITSGALIGALSSQGLPLVQAPPALAAAVGHIAVRGIAGGLGQDPARIDANYVRRSDAELAWVEVRRAAEKSS